MAVPPKRPYEKLSPFKGRRVAAAVYTLRHRHGWSQEVLARQLGVSYRHVQRLESGRDAIGPLALMRITWLSQVLGHADLAEYFGGLLRRMLAGAPGLRESLSGSTSTWYSEIRTEEGGEIDER